MPAGRDRRVADVPPGGSAQGIVGGGFARLIGGRRAEEDDDMELPGMAGDYQMASYFEELRPLAFGGGRSRRRMLREGGAAGGRAKFPLHARGGSIKAARVRKTVLCSVHIPSRLMSLAILLHVHFVTAERMVLERDSGVDPTFSPSAEYSKFCSHKMKCYL